MLTYKITYQPNVDAQTNALKNVNFLCSDNKIHIRLRDYDREEVIHGFINKLTYVITYLFQRNANTEELTDNIIEKFVNSDESIKSLNMWLFENISSLGKKYKGLKISKNYRKIKNKTPLGSFAKGTCPLKDGVTYGDIDFLDSSLAVTNIVYFLLNDSFDIVIEKSKVKDSYKKFRNKIKKSKKETLEYIPLF